MWVHPKQLPFSETSAVHSYQTFDSSVFLQIDTLNVALAGTNRGSFSGKKSGNQENIPTEKSVGRVDRVIVVSSRVLEYRVAENVPRNP